MKTISTWSFSRLMDYESCPFKAWLKYAERIADPRPSIAAERGTAIHALAEDYILGKIDPLPKELNNFSDEFKSLRARSKDLMLEQEWGFDNEWQPCEYRGDKTWGRVKADCVLPSSPTSGIVIDFKTGKKHGNEVKHGEQIQLYALAAFIRYPDWASITCELWYLDANDLTSIVISRKTAMERYLKTFDRRLRAMTSATEFPAKPNIVSCKWCPYGDTGHCDKRVVDQQASNEFYKRKFSRNK